MRGKEEGFLATELQTIMGPCEAWGGLHNPIQSITGRLCQYYIMHTKLYNVYYKCLPQANFFLEMVVILNFSHVFDE